jgi:hypothetical protein
MRLNTEAPYLQNLGGIMLGRTVAVLGLVACCLVTGVPPSLAGGKSTPASTVQSGWYDTDSNAAHSRANLAEKVLTPSAVTKVKYLRGVVAPPPNGPCGITAVAAPLPYGGNLYAVTGASVSKYNPATAAQTWQRALNSSFVYYSLAVAGNLVITAGTDCRSESDPSGIVYALNASTGAVVWKSAPANRDPADDMTKVGSYVITEGASAGAGAGVSVLNLGDGSLAWSSFCYSGDTPDPTALVVDTLVLSYGCDSAGNNPTLDARNLATGALVWSLPGFWTAQRGDLSGSAGKHLYATNPAGTVVDLNPLTGQVNSSLSQAVNVLAVDASRVYATCGASGQYVCAYNTGTGTLEWQDTQLSASPRLGAEADGVLYLDFGPALNAATGQVIKKCATGCTPSVAALAVGDGRIAISQYSRILDLYGLPGY